MTTTKNLIDHHLTGSVEPRFAGVSPADPSDAAFPARYPRKAPWLKRQVSLLAAVLGLLAFGSGARAIAEKPVIDPTYANGQTVNMIGPHLITDPNPKLLEQAEELYLLVYPVNPTGSTTLGQITLPSNYQPQCNPCFHPGVPLEFSYHDHLITGAPGAGTQGTAGEFKGPWKIIILVYNPEVALSPDFKPITNADDLDAAEANGEFLPISPDADNPFEINTGAVLICPIVSPKA